MKRLLLTAALLFLLASSAFPITAQEEQLIVDNALAVLGQTTLELPDTLPVHRICGTSTIMEAKLRFNELSPSAQAALRPLLSARPARQKIYDTPSGHFRIHYDTTGSDAVRNAAVRNAQGIPVWVDTLAMVLDSIWNKEVTQMGFRAPVGDSFYSPNGGDGRLDVYLEDLGLGLGLTFPDSAGGVLGNRATAFILLDNDYNTLPYNDPLYGIGPSGAMRVTAAHEFFHAIQFAYTVYGAEVVSGNLKLYWYEATAVWMEEQTYNEINDYIQYLPFWFDAPGLSFRTFEQPGGDLYRVFRPYAMGIYGIYLSNRFANTTYGYSAVRRVWERMATVPGFNLFAALDYALGSEGSNFLSSLQEFYQWNYFVGRNSPLNVSFYAPEDSIWPTFDSYRDVDSTTNYPTRHPKIYIPCNNCHPVSIRFFCAPCSVNTVGFPCSTKCATACPFIPYQLSTSAFCVNDLEDLGASYLNLQNPGRGGSFMDFALVSDTSRPAPFFVSLARYSIGPPRTYSFLTDAFTDSSGRTPNLFLPGIRNFSEVVATVMNNELLPDGAPRQASAYAYSANVDSSTPSSITDIIDGRPNPFRPGIDQLVKFPISLDSLSGAWDINLIVFSPAGEIVYKNTLELLGGFSYREAINWDGKNRSGRSVASGVYFCKIIMEEKGTSRKLEKVAKIALIRQ